MKKQVIIFLYLLTITLNVQAIQSPFNDVYVPISPGRFKFSFGLLWARPSIFDLTYAVTPVNVFRLDSTPQMNDFVFQNLSPALKWGYDFDLGYELPGTGNDVRLNFSRLTNHTSDRKERGNGLNSTLFSFKSPQLIDAITVITPGGNLDTTFAKGKILTDFDIDFVEAKHGFYINQLAAEFGQRIHLTPDLSLRFFGGLKGVKIHDSLTGLLVSKGVRNRLIALQGEVALPFLNKAIPFQEVLNLTQADVNYEKSVQDKSCYSGLGPLFGLDANYYLDIGIGLFANFSTAMLVGFANSQLSDSTQFKLTGFVLDDILTQPGDIVLISSFHPGEVILQERDKIHIFNLSNHINIAPNLSAKLGITYSPCLPCTHSQIFIEGGYMINHYFNTIERTLINASGLSRGNKIEDLSINGFYLKLEMRV